MLKKNVLALPRHTCCVKFDVGRASISIVAGALFGVKFSVDVESYLGAANGCGSQNTRNSIQAHVLTGNTKLPARAHVDDPDVAVQKMEVLPAVVAPTHVNVYYDIYGRV